MRDARYLRSQAEICLHNCPFRACVANVSEMDHRNDWSRTRLSKPARRCLALWERNAATRWQLRRLVRRNWARICRRFVLAA
jgi:hypothetical protein